MTELCRRYGISRITGYKWLSRYQEGGAVALQDRSHAPHSHPFQILDAVEEAILAARSRNPRWGPAKLRHWLEETAPEVKWPAPSTIANILNRNGLSVSRNGRQSGAGGTSDQIWRVELGETLHCLDGQGYFPVRITDSRSGFLLRFQVLRCRDAATLGRLFEAAFREFGLPHGMRAPGVPPFFAGGRLSDLAAWWIRLAIQPVRLPPHKALCPQLPEAVRAPRASLREQQRAFNDFRHRYNHGLPQKRLGGRAPADVYRPSTRRYPSELVPVL